MIGMANLLWKKGESTRFAQFLKTLLSVFFLILLHRNIDHLTASTYTLRSGLDDCFESSRIIRLICEVAKETGFTIGTLHDLQKINELKTDQRFSDVCNSSIVKLFYGRIWDSIHAMLTQANVDGKSALIRADGDAPNTCNEISNCYDIFSK